jgi:hypothetical protein
MAHTHEENPRFIQTAEEGTISAETKRTSAAKQAAEKFENCKKIIPQGL